MSPQQRRRRVRWVVWGGLVVLALALVAGLVVGATDVAPSTVLRALASRMLPSGWVAIGDLGPIDMAIAVQMRAPRVVLAAMVGAALALAGAIMQGIFRNPLAAPGVIGTSAGAAFGALCAIASGLALRSLFYLPLLASVGGVLSLILVLRVATRSGVTPVATLLLAGVAVNAFLGAANGWIIAQSWSEWEVARRIAFWMMGGVTDRDWSHVAILAPFLVVGTTLAIRRGRDLDIMLEGDDTAMALGVDVHRVRFLLLVVSALLTGGAVAVSGMVGFVGLVVPHLCRMWIGPSHRALLVASAVTGAWFLVLADLLARTATRPVELHLGVVTATVGAPFFLWLLRQNRSRGGLL